ncbi:TRAP transporter substrate-binding protein [candidate division KSB1 bacterium]|nr:TRAP transporter substrate-binding protein [candidate division KSB1 bacterium]
MKPVKFSQLIFLLFLIVWVFGCGTQNSVKTLKLAHVLPTSHPVHQGMVHLADVLEKESNGQMKVDIYPGGVLGNERECLESLQIGSLDMTKVSSSVLENFVPSVAVLSLPYLFKDKEHRWRVFESGIGQKMLLDGEKVWLRGLCFYESGERNFYLVKDKVEIPQDLQGLKIRVMRSNISIKAVEALGAQSAPISFGELFTALAAGVVDGAENNIPTIHQSKHYEVCKYICMDGHSAPSDMLLISTHIWNRLTGQEKQWLNLAVKASVEKQKMLWEQSIRDALSAFEKKGVTVIWPDKAPFEKTVDPLYLEMKRNKNPLYDLVVQIRRLSAES